jgi:hypothetical protein
MHSKETLRLSDLCSRIPWAALPFTENCSDGGIDNFVTPYREDLMKPSESAWKCCSATFGEEIRLKNGIDCKV